MKINTYFCAIALMAGFSLSSSDSLAHSYTLLEVGKTIGPKKINVEGDLAISNFSCRVQSIDNSYGVATTQVETHFGQATKTFSPYFMLWVTGKVTGEVKVVCTGDMYSKLGPQPGSRTGHLFYTQYFRIVTPTNPPS